MLYKIENAMSSKGLYMVNVDIIPKFLTKSLLEINLKYKNLDSNKT